ncbi:MAG: PEP-CTERM sorting domain-containing protein [Pirellulales bacterium]|nr:PEP-CTERM sorting domain-containing protein [Pirellulales bacterium]
MDRAFVRAILCCATAVFILGNCAFAQWDVYAYSQGSGSVPIPDVDKNPANAPPPPLVDNSCWMAAASNLLAGAGWGLSTQTPQQNADAIYGHMTSHFNIINGGFTYRAINWWLYNYGYNPDDTTGYYNPGNMYSDVTYVERTLTAGDYDYLLGELASTPNNQYVAVSFILPAPAECGHVMTLVGGNYSTSAGSQTSVWHDSDQDVGGTDDDTYTNVWGGGGPTATWWLDYGNTGPGGDDWLADAYHMLCPGLTKPQDAMENYDWAYYRDQNASGDWFLNSREAGLKAADFDDPYWWDSNTLVVDNELIQDQRKNVYLLIDYIDQDNNSDPGITLISSEDELTEIAPTLIEYSDDYGQILLTWELDHQPAWEKIIFPASKYHDLSLDVKDFNIATICVPEPSTMLMLALAVIGFNLVFRRRV